MEIVVPSQLELVSSSPEQARTPLTYQVNSRLQPPTVEVCKKIRRKPSLICRIDSSEETPTLNESIFHAECFSSSNSEDNSSEIWSKVTINSPSGPTKRLAIVGNNENLRSQFLSPIDGITPILYGHGTALSTIVERKSTTTMGTKISSTNPGSASEVSLVATSTLNLLGRCGSLELPSTVTVHPPHRRKSFSADDIAFIKRAYHEACTVIEMTAGCAMQIHDIYAEPRAPIVPPIERPSTPPGMPSWTEAQHRLARNAAPRQAPAIRGTKNKLRRFLDILPGRIELPSCIHKMAALQNANRNEQAGGGRPTSTPLPVRVAPRFRPTTSGHGVGPLSMHPFLRRDRADAKSDVSFPIPKRQTPSNRPCSRNAAPHSAPKAQATSIRRRHVVQEGIPTPCLHRQSRRASLRGSRKPARVTAESPTTGPVMSGAITPSNGTVPPLATVAARHAKRCWKCRVSSLVSRLDSVWDASADWCCWVFCGVDPLDDGELGGRGCDAASPNDQAVLRPRKVRMGGLPSNHVDIGG